MENNKTILKVLVVSALSLAGFGYAVYFLFGEISSAGDIYTAKSAELGSIEKKQGQIDQMVEGVVGLFPERMRKFLFHVSVEFAIEDFLRVQ